MGERGEGAFSVNWSLKGEGNQTPFCEQIERGKGAQDYEFLSLYHPELPTKMPWRK